jgi:hypothetical protein
VSVYSTACLCGEEFRILPQREIFGAVQLFEGTVIHSRISGLNVTSSSKFTNTAVVYELLASFLSFGKFVAENRLFTPRSEVSNFRSVISKQFKLLG